MSRIRLKTIVAPALALMGFHLSPVQACEFHGAFGGTPWGQHSINPKAKQSALTAPSLVKAELGAPIVIEVELDLKPSEVGAEIDLRSDMDATIKLTEQEVRDISSSVKLYRLAIVPEKLGTFRLSFTANIDNSDSTSVKMTSTYLRVVSSEKSS
jgi:hypothetical protein